MDKVCLDAVKIGLYDLGMEFLDQILQFIGPYLLLLPVPIIIFSATPRMPFWYKSGRILFMWFIIFIFISFVTFVILTSDEEVPCCVSKEYVMMEHLGGLFSLTVLINVYIGWWEFLWRCVYRQWTWPLLKNLQYGIVSNLAILGFAIVTIPLAYVLIIVGIIKLL